MRIRKKPWSQNELNTNEHLIESPQSHIGRWSEVFGNNNPIHIEIGCGKGKFIVESAQRNGAVNFIGMEKEPVIAAAALRLARESEASRNLAFIVTNASELSDIFSGGEISRIYINFPDPWDRKKKWIKRRLTHRDFLNIYESVLDPVEIFLKTDNKILFNFSLSEFRELGYSLENVTNDLHNSGYDGNIMTEYESRFFSQGKPIYRLEARK